MTTEAPIPSVKFSTLESAQKYVAANATISMSDGVWWVATLKINGRRIKGRGILRHLAVADAAELALALFLAA